MERDEQIKQAAIERGCIEGTAEYFGFIQGARYADQNPKNPWIDINERLPEAKKRVIFLCNDKKAYFGYNNIDNKSATITNAPNGVKVTHWMPVPEV